MDPAPATQTPAVAESPRSTGPGGGQAPVGYNLVKVRKADGTVVTVKRKLSPGKGGTVPAAAQGVIPDTGASSPAAETPRFTTVTVRKPDGTLVKVRRPLTKQSAVTETEKVAARQADPRHVEPSTTVADAKLAVEKSTPTDITPVPTVTTSATKKARPTDGVKEIRAVAGETVDADRLKTNDDAPIFKADAGDLPGALAEQAIYNREGRTHRLKSSLLRGFGMAVGSALPSLEISHDFEDGDKILSDDDDDYSVDEMDEGDECDDDEYSISDELHARNETDDGAAHGVDNSTSAPHVTFDAGAALGGLAATAAANAAAQPPPPRADAQAAARAAQNGGAPKPEPEKEKHTYKITAKELADIEQATTEKVTEKKLNRHWANLTFYFMASLSIILPSLFILLAGFIGGMNGKLVGSSWNKMEDPIKVAISAWPIVFAAVVAQCFKAWATFKVERGIKLMELEQLVGSSSFASAIKQPVLLRRLDLLTLALFAVWCLSPLGSQALLRVYSLDRRLVTNTSEVRLAPSYGPNRLFTLSNDTKIRDNPEYSELLQLVETFYIASLAPVPWLSKYVTDSYLHPIMFASPQEGDETSTSDVMVQAFGSFLTYPQSQLSYDSPSTASAERAESTIPRFEQWTFNISYSYFSFSCGPWQNRTLQELDAADDFIMLYSESGTLGLTFTSADNTTLDYSGIRLASANGAELEAKTTAAGGSGTTKKPWEDPDYPFSYIECGFKQLFEEVTVTCVTDPTTTYPDCRQDGESTALPAERTADMKTSIGDFSYEMTNANPGVLGDSPATLTEFYLLTGMGVDTNSNNGLIMSKDVSLADFETRFGYLFNTFLGLGYCPECVTLFMNDQTTSQSPEVDALYKTIKAQVRYANDLVYVISGPWLAGFAVCAGILFLAGLAGVVVESMTVAPDVLGYVSTVARNSRYLQLPKTSSAMSGGERAKTVGGVKVMMQDVKGNANVGKIALGLKHEKAQRLVPGRLYR